MKDIYVIMAFHAHELLWDLPEKMLSYLDKDNPMKNTILDMNYMKKRKEENRDVYTLGIQLAELLDAPICVEYSNELLHQLDDVEPGVFERLKEEYRKGRMYPVYGHAHHTHVSLLRTEEITQEIVWNMQYLHHHMGVPYPKYKGLFSPEASYSYDKINSLEYANIDYVIFPHLNENKVLFKIKGHGDYRYKPFIIKTSGKKILALPRNFPVSQEIWRPITKMKRDAVKNQGYKLGDYAVFYNEYLTGHTESFPVDMNEGVEIYKEVLRGELNNAPADAVIVYIQDLELMDFGDIAIEILGKAWKDILEEDRERYQIHFVTPDYYIDKVLKPHGMEILPEVEFEEICWAPEIRLVLRSDGHYPPLGVTGKYDARNSGAYRHPLIFWENGKYYCGIFDDLLDSFTINIDITANAERLNSTGYDLAPEPPETRAVMYARLMKRACNWGWRPTEGRQKRPCLNGFLLCETLLEIIEQYPNALLFKKDSFFIDSRNIAGINETLKVFIDQRLDYLRFGMEKYMTENDINLSEAYREIEEVESWRNIALQKAKSLYDTNKNESLDFVTKMKTVLILIREYSQAVFMATDHIQKIWGVIPDVDFMVDHMYEYLYNLYPPLFPAMIDKIDSMSDEETDNYFKTIIDAPEFTQR